MTSIKVLVRHSRNDQPMKVEMVKKDEFDFTDYRFLRLSNSVKNLEEWVHKDDLGLYQRADKLFQIRKGSDDEQDICDEINNG